MKLSELKKIYEFSAADDAFLIEVQLDQYQNVYSDWDFSPFINRDLDKDLTEYLLDCSYEIPLKYKLVIVFFILNQDENKSREDRSIIGIHNYFKYQLRKLKTQRWMVFRDIVTFAIVGAGLLFTSMTIKKYISESFASIVFTEGLVIGGWVMFWEMFSAFFFSMSDVRYKKKHFDRLNSSGIEYRHGRKGEV